MASTQLHRTPSGAGNRKTFTISFWVKRSKLSSGQYIAHIGNQEANPQAGIEWTSNDRFQFWNHGSSGSSKNLTTTRKFRDTSGWYHFVIAVDTTQATESNRVKIYVNGVQETIFDTEVYPDQNYDYEWNSTQRHTIGAYYNNQSYFDGLLSHIHFIDGTAYAASTFGSTDSTTGEWKINTSPSVTYGSNGFFILKDGNSVTDQSGNSNNFTVAGGTLSNTEDCPSNVFAILNPLGNSNASNTLAHGNTQHSCSTNWCGFASSIGALAGKYYAEIKVTDKDNVSMGVCQSNGDTFANLSTANNNRIGKYNDGWGWDGNGSSYQKYHNNSASNYGSALSNNDIFMIAVDVTGGKIYFGKNGTWFDSSDPANGTNPAFTGETFTQSIHFASGSETGVLQWNFGNGFFGSTAISSEGTNASGIGKFEYDVPTGYTALSTKGLNE